ncbi:MAG: hypothetical protein QNJ14_02655 [Woeseiaceae bacterium]|nr:hypothetical protein [Woeseiaceae bacterium]
MSLRRVLSAAILCATLAPVVGLVAGDGGYQGSHFKRAVFIVSDLDRSLALWRDVLQFDVNPVNDLTGSDSYVFELMNVPTSSVVRMVSFNAGDVQIRTMLLLEVPDIGPLPDDEVHRSTVVINANGRFAEIAASVEALGLEMKSANRFVTPEGDAGIEQGFVDWDGNLVLIYELGD